MACSSSLPADWRHQGQAVGRPWSKGNILRGAAMLICWICKKFQFPYLVIEKHHAWHKTTVKWTAITYPHIPRTGRDYNEPKVRYLVWTAARQSLLRTVCRGLPIRGSIAAWHLPSIDEYSRVGYLEFHSGRWGEREVQIALEILIWQITLDEDGMKWEGRQDDAPTHSIWTCEYGFVMREDQCVQKAI